MEFLEVVGSRRSIRWFKTWEKVPREKIQRILEAVRLTTCPGNLQPWRAIVVEQLTKERLLQEPMPKAGRFDELKFLSRMYGYPD